MPGPPVVVCKGDTVVVDVINQLQGSTTSLHFHGKFHACINGTNNSLFALLMLKLQYYNSMSLVLAV